MKLVSLLVYQYWSRAVAQCSIVSIACLAPGLPPALRKEKTVVLFSP